MVSFQIDDCNVTAVDANHYTEVVHFLSTVPGSNKQRSESVLRDRLNFSMVYWRCFAHPRKSPFSSIFVGNKRKDCKPVMMKDTKATAYPVGWYDNMQGPIVTGCECEGCECDVDFQLFSKTMTGAVLPPFPSSGSIQETHLPSKESNWRVLLAMDARCGRLVASQRLIENLLHKGRLSVARDSLICTCTRKIAIRISGRFISRARIYTNIDGSRVSPLLLAIDDKWDILNAQNTAKYATTLEALGLIGTSKHGAAFLLASSSNAAGHAIEAVVARHGRGTKLAGFHILGSICGVACSADSVFLNDSAEVTPVEYLATYIAISRLVARPWGFLVISSKQEIKPLVTDGPMWGDEDWHEEKHKKMKPYIHIDPHILCMPVLADIDNARVREMVVVVSYFFDLEYLEKQEHFAELGGITIQKFLASGIVAFIVDTKQAQWTGNLTLRIDTECFRAYICSSQTVEAVEGDGHTDIVIQDGQQLKELTLVTTSLDGILYLVYGSAACVDVDTGQTPVGEFISSLLQRLCDVVEEFSALGIPIDTLRPLEALGTHRADLKYILKEMQGKDDTLPTLMIYATPLGFLLTNEAQKGGFIALFKLEDYITAAIPFSCIILVASALEVPRQLHEEPNQLSDCEKKDVSAESREYSVPVDTLPNLYKVHLIQFSIPKDLLALDSETALHVAELDRRLGMRTNMYPSSALLGHDKDESIDALLVHELIEKADGFAGVEHKYEIHKRLQARKHIGGMSGDGVHVAPAQKKVDIGIAIVDATNAASFQPSVIIKVSEGIIAMVIVLVVIRSFRVAYLGLKTSQLFHRVFFAHFDLEDKVKLDGWGNVTNHWRADPKTLV